MKRRGAFSPTAFDRLEDRVVLTQHLTRGLSVVVGGLFPNQQVLNRNQQPVIAEINQAFDSFKADYGQARATYFASILNQPNPSQATTDAFTLYTTQRVSLLGQQIASAFLQSSLGAVHAKGQPSSLKQLIGLKIIGAQNQAPAGSLAKALTDTIPRPGTSAATASLYSLSQDQAIETARVAVLNGVNIVKNGDFGNKSKAHHH